MKEIMYKFFDTIAAYKFSIKMSGLMLATITLPDLIFATAAMKLLVATIGTSLIIYEAYKKRKK